MIIPTTMLDGVNRRLKGVSVKLEPPNTHVTRSEIGDMRMELTIALAKLNAVERLAAGAPVPKSGD